MPHEHQTEKERSSNPGPRQAQDQKERDAKNCDCDDVNDKRRSEDDSRIEPQPTRNPQVPQPERHRQQQR